ncbi:MAG: prolipoprotein diacylglyceryl transferase [Bacteroidetes bacterium]|nr:prolipoprotein diacylglyceryl transferase [Bacteroidota bacterium]
MTFPIEIRVGDIHLSLHPVFEMLAFAIGFRYFTYLRARSTDYMSDDTRVKIIIGAIFGAFIGSRMLGALEDPYAFVHSAHKLLYFYSSKTIVGGLLGGLWGVEIAKLIIGEKRSSGDLFTFPIILAMIIGRIGCFTSGITEPTYGVETTSMLGMNLGDGLMRHPIALYEIAFLLILWLVLYLINGYNSALQSGDIFKLFMIFYLIFRFAIDFIKPVHLSLGILSSIQLACVIGILYYIQTIIRLMLWVLRPHTDPRGESFKP